MRPVKLMHLTLAIAFAAGPSLAEPFVLLIHETPEQIALRDDKGPAGMAYWTAYADFGKTATAAGILRGGAAMMPTPAAVSGTEITQGALVLGGFFQIDVADLAEAQSWAAKLPAAQTGAVEIRAAIAAPGM
jgi:hypothetical protein